MSEMIIEVSPATTASLEHLFDEAKRRNDSMVQYVKSVEGFAENLIDFAITRKRSYWESRDKSQVGRALFVALDKMQRGKELTKAEAELVERFQTAKEAVAA